MPTRCLPVAEVAELLSVSKDAVYDLVEKGQLQAVRIGRRMSIPEPAYEAFVAGGGGQIPRVTQLHGVQSRKAG